MLQHMDNVWFIALSIWSTIGIVVVFIYMLFRSGDEQRWSHARGAIGIYIAGIFYLAGGYSAIAGIYNMIKGTVPLTNVDSLGNNERTFLYLYHIGKYSWMVLISVIIKSRLKLNILSLLFKYFLIVAMISIVCIISEVGGDLNLLIKNESYICVAIVSLSVFIKVCWKLFKGFENKEDGKTFRTIIAAVISFCISIVANAFIWKYVDSFIYRTL